VAGLEPTRLRASRLPSLAECEEWIGWRVDDINGSMMGLVEALRTDESGAPAWIVVSEFMPGEGRRFVIPVADAVGGAGRVWSPHPRRQIRLSAQIAEALVSPQADQRLREHYASERRAA
jgi:hypothetical protein